MERRRTDPRFATTAIMWVAAAIITVSVAPFDSFWGMIVPLSAAVLGTIVVWMADAEKAKFMGGTAESERGENIEKMKRDPDSKMRLLLEMMDDDERQAFKETLKRQILQNARYNDGELDESSVSLEALLAEPQKQLRK